jgi:Cu-Zn family superoxide dismutase
MRVAIWGAGMTAFALAGCAMNGPMTSREPAAAAEPSATAIIRNSAGLQMAQATASQSGDGIRIRVEAIRMSPGTYGAHVHSTGRCDAPDFATAGPHWNPTSHQHGTNNPQGLHMGDLPNLMVGADGRGSLEITIPSASLSQGATPLLDADGAAIVIHERADDYRTDPSGNSGTRIACGVFS